MPDLLSASSQSLLAGLLGNHSPDCLARSLARKPWSPAELRPGCPALGQGLGHGLGQALPTQQPGEPPHRGCGFCARYFPGPGSSRDAGVDAGPFTPAAAPSLPSRRQVGSRRSWRRSEGLGQVRQLSRRWVGNQETPQHGALLFLPFPCPASTARSQPRGYPLPALCQCLQRVRSRQHHIPCPAAQSLPQVRASLPPILICTGSTMEGHRGCH